MLRFCKGQSLIDAPLSLQQTAAAATVKQTLSVQKVSPVPTWCNKTVACFMQDTCLWPRNFTLLPSYKLLHMTDLGVEGVKQLNGVLLEGLKNEPKALQMDDSMADAIPAGLECEFAKFFGVQWEPSEFVERALQA